MPDMYTSVYGYIYIYIHVFVYIICGQGERILKKAYKGMHVLYWANQGLANCLLLFCKVVINNVCIYIYMYLLIYFFGMNIIQMELFEPLI